MGKFVNGAGSDKETDCELCEEGKYLDEIGSDGDGPVGRSVATVDGVVITTDSNDCKACVVGKYIETKGADSAGDCIKCGMGKYNDVAGLALERGMTNLPRMLLVTFVRHLLVLLFQTASFASPGNISSTKGRPRRETVTCAPKVNLSRLKAA
jgi:hypothetical protein